MKTTVIVESKTRDKLREIGHKGDTYDKIILQLIQNQGLQKTRAKSGGQD